MPETTFTVQWPDGRLDECYSPSLVVHEHLETGTDYTVGDFARRATYALALASDRVRDRFGVACTAAAATTEQIQARAGRFRTTDTVRVVAMTDAPPRTEQAP